MGNWMRIFGAIGIVFVLSILTVPVLDQLAILRADTHIADYTSFDVFLKLTPAILWLFGLGGAGFLAFSGVKGIRGGDGHGGGLR
ncbi:hypothetical protein [Dehalococcoides mccartyi]|uniref:hypothetical protein n=1 Tax=Dehalococcoides mccartyi TaxID=61435 RepID=UPI0006BC3FFB|nr:hypothetical protein [Dehalococcoides mccartyi]BAS31172.1 hypothetical protein IBK_0097 [Dehalococcoides mccartyi IBARAKI]